MDPSKLFVGTPNLPFSPSKCTRLKLYNFSPQISPSAVRINLTSPAQNTPYLDTQCPCQEPLVYLNDNKMHSPYCPVYYAKVLGLKYVWWLIDLLPCCAAVRLTDHSVIILQRFMIILNVLFPVTFNILRCMLYSSLYSHSHVTLSLNGV